MGEQYFSVSSGALLSLIKIQLRWMISDTKLLWVGRVKWSEKAVGWSMCCCVIAFSIVCLWSPSWSVAEMTFSLAYVLNVAFVALYHMSETGKKAGREKKCKTWFPLWSKDTSCTSYVTTESIRIQGACLRCLALTSMPRRFLQRRYEEESTASRHRWEERRMLRLLEMTWGIFGKAGLNVITNGIRSVGFCFDGGFECCTARNLAYFFYCVFNEAVFISSLYKVCCECTRACIEELIFWTN